MLLTIHQSYYNVQPTFIHLLMADAILIQKDLEQSGDFDPTNETDRSVTRCLLALVGNIH